MHKLNNDDVPDYCFSFGRKVNHDASFCALTQGQGHCPFKIFPTKFNTIKAESIQKGVVHFYKSNLYLLAVYCCVHSVSHSLRLLA